MTINAVGQKMTVALPNKHSVEVTVPEKPTTADKAIAKPDFVDQQLTQLKDVTAEKKAQEKAAFEQIFDKADKDKTGKVDLSEFDALVMGVAEHKDAAAAKTASVEAPIVKTVTIKPGDTLGRVARENGVSLDELKAANPDLFQKGKDGSGKLRTAGGDLIYPGDAVKIPGKPAPAPAVEEKPAVQEKPTAEEKPVTEEKPAAETGKVEGGGPEQPSEEAAAPALSEQGKNGRALLGAAAEDASIVRDWTVQEKADILAYVRDSVTVGMDKVLDEQAPPAERAEAAQSIGKAIDAVKAFTTKHGLFELESNVRDIEKAVKPEELVKKAVDGVEADLEARLSAKTGKKDFKIEFLDDMSDADKLKQFALIDSLLADPSYDATWKTFDSIGIDVYESKRDGAQDNLKGYVEVDGGMLKLNNPGNGWGGDDGLKDVEVDKQRRALQHLRDTGKQP